MASDTKILYVDDEELNLLVFETNFYKKYQIFIAENGNKGLEILEENPDIKIVISDMKMPEMDGLEFIKKANKKLPEVKYYILTGYEITPEIQYALDSGLISNYFSKPFNVQEIDSEMAKSIYK